MINKIKHEVSTVALLRVLDFRGLSRDVASQLSVSRQYISQVIHGKRRDERVIKALWREFSRRKRLLDRHESAA